MKAITLYPRYAAAIASGEKTIEYRTWRTRHRGDIAIHAGRPFGAVIAVVELYDVTGEPGSWEWHLRDPRPVYPPAPARGMPGLWEWEPEKGNTS